MDINVKQAAADYLHTKFSGSQRLLLALDDGSSKYSKLGGSCAIGNKFQFVVTDQADADYATPLANTAGLPITTGNLEGDYLGNGLTLDYRQGALALRDDSGLLDGAVSVVQLATTAVTDTDKQTLGGMIC